MSGPNGSDKHYKLRQTGSGRYMSCNSNSSNSMKTSSPTIHRGFFNSRLNIYNSVWKKRPKNRRSSTNRCPRFP